MVVVLYKMKFQLLSLASIAFAAVDIVLAAFALFNEPFAIVAGSAVVLPCSFIVVANKDVILVVVVSAGRVYGDHRILTERVQEREF